MEAEDNKNNDGKIIEKDIEKEMKTAYIDYAMSVIVSRALPDVRDGLKPVHRRILYAMYEDGITSDKPYRKCANTVGSVLGRYHPHGDASVYDAMVRMAQDFSLRYPLIDGHGNFGSIDGDGAAAMRYTEARMAKIAETMLTDIEKNTVDFMPNYDDRLQEPTVLPSKIPTLLINGSSGIAVGMATNIPPHNLTEVINGIIKIIDEDNVTDEELLKIIKGPDFPTSGLILGREGIKQAYTTGRGKIIVRAEAEIEEMENGRQRIIVRSLPYQVNKARLIENIANLVKDKKIEGISELRDESDRNDKVRIVIGLKKDANAQVVLNHLYKNTQLQDTFGIIMLALVNGEPKILTLRQCLDCYIDHRKDVILRRTQFDLDKALATFVLANGAAATGQKVTVFFTFWGLNVLKKVQKPKVKKDIFGRMFGMMLPSSSLKLKLSQMNMFGMGSRMMRFLMKRKGVDSLESLRSQALAQGVEFIACQMSMDMMGICREELLDEVTIGGVATYMERADKANVNLFI